jgi:hypothetical protein
MSHNFKQFPIADTITKKHKLLVWESNNRFYAKNPETDRINVYDNLDKAYYWSNALYCKDVVVFKSDKRYLSLEQNEFGLFGIPEYSIV